MAQAKRRGYGDGHRLAERRKAAGLTQADVAERMGVTKSRISPIERGEVSPIGAPIGQVLDYAIRYAPTPLIA